MSFGISITNSWRFFIVIYGLDLRQYADEFVGNLKAVGHINHEYSLNDASNASDVNNDDQ